MTLTGSLIRKSRVLRSGPVHCAAKQFPRCLIRHRSMLSPPAHLPPKPLKPPLLPAKKESPRSHRFRDPKEVPGCELLKSSAPALFVSSGRSIPADSEPPTDAAKAPALREAAANGSPAESIKC